MAAEAGDARWYSVLDDIDQHITEQEAAAEAGRWDAIVAFPLPAGLGPIPPTLRGRLARLAARSERLEELVAERRDQLAGRIGVLPRGAAGAPRAACYLDFNA